MSYDLLSMLPEGATSRTRLALRDGRRKVVLRQVRDAVEPFLPESTPEAVLPLIEVWEVQGARYAVYDYAPGVSLRELVEALREQDRPVPLGLVGRILVDAARAVGEVHATHPPLPAHGGLSDAALLVGFDGAVRVLDYGVPRPSRFQPSVSSGPHGDVFALGAVLHSVLTDFAGSYADAVDEGVPLPPPTHLHDEATPALDDVLARATSRAFARRQVDAGSLADELEAVLGDALFTRPQVAEAVGTLFSVRASAAARAVQLEPDEASLADADNAPTGAHPAPWLRTDATSPALEAVGDRPTPTSAKGPAVPWVTGMTMDNLPAAGQRPLPGIPSGTEPGQPGPALTGRIPSGTEPGQAGPFSASHAELGEDDALSGTALRARHPVAAASERAALGSDEGALEGTAPRATRPAELGSDEGALEGTAPRATRPAELGSDEGALDGTAPRAARPVEIAPDDGVAALGSDEGAQEGTAPRARLPDAAQTGDDDAAPAAPRARLPDAAQTGDDAPAAPRARLPGAAPTGDDDAAPAAAPRARLPDAAQTGDDDAAPAAPRARLPDAAPAAARGARLPFAAKTGFDEDDAPALAAAPTGEDDDGPAEAAGAARLSGAVSTGEEDDGPAEAPRARLSSAAQTGGDDDDGPAAAPGARRARRTDAAPAGDDEAAGTSADGAPRAAASAGPRPRPSSVNRPSSARARPSRAAAEAPSTAENDVPAADAGDTGDEDAPPPLVEHEPTRPRASAPVPPPRRARADAEPDAPALGDGEPEPTRPRARVPLSAQDTHPRAPGVANLDTAPRASAPRSRNTTVHERLQARGQERIATPPVGVSAVSAPADEPPEADELDHGLVNEPTNVRAKPGVKKPPPPPGSEGELPATEEAGPRSNSARPIIAGLLLLLALGFGSVALFAPQKFLALRVKLGLAKAPEPEPDEAPVDVPADDVGDAGAAAAVAEDGGGAAAVAALDDADGGEDEDDDADGGDDEDEGDAGAAELTAAGATDAGVPDGGALQDGGATKPEVKSPPKKKKKKRRRHR